MGATRRIRSVARHLSAPVEPAASASSPAMPEPGKPGAALPAKSPLGPPILLSDTEMLDYLREGYCAFQLDDLPAEYHASIVERLDNVIEKHGNPGNNMLPMVPELTRMLEHPLIDGALQSILGTDYYKTLAEDLSEEVGDDP